MRQKIALITGATRSIGKGLALTLAQSGYHVLVTGRNQAQLTEVCKQIAEAGGFATSYVLDVSKQEQISGVMDKIIDTHKHIDVLINNAGIYTSGTSTAAANDVIHALNTNLLGAILIANKVAALMKIQQSGYIINISSVSGKIALANSGIYNATKFGLCGFNEALAKEMAAFNVKVSAICPGFVATDMTDIFNFPKELMMPVSDISHTVKYLLSLSSHALPMEVIINCLPSVAAQSAQDQGVLGKKAKI